MDVIEDFVEVLRIVLDYVGVDIDDVSDLLRRLNIQQRLAVQHFCRGVVYRWNHNVIQPHLRMSQRWQHWRSNIRHRSLIRVIGTCLPLKPVRRLKINSRMLKNFNRYDSFNYDSDTSLYSYPTSVESDLQTDEEVVLVEEELGDNCIRIRAQKNDDEDDNEDSDTSISGDIADDMFLMRNKGNMSPMNSTMISSISMMSSCDPNAMHKITAMEDELKSLREQLALLVSNQEQVNKSHAFISSTQLRAEGSPDSAIHITDSVGTPNTPVILSAPPAVAYIPPPPPLPPTPNSRKLDKQSTVTAEDAEQFTVIMEKPPINSVKKTKQPTLSDVLKDLNSVKLRAVQRSPGGTPLKKRPPLLSNNSDPASVIAQALKKKFSSQHLYSPEVDKENQDCSFDAENSPHVIPGKPKAKRRSLLFNEKKRKSIGPLRD